MNKTELVKKISESLNISEDEQNIFFEIFLRRCSEVLSNNESITITGLGKFSYDKSINENDLIAFVTNDNERILFDIPNEENEVLPIDSYFSISIGKPVIPLKGLTKEENIVPNSDYERKKLLELKVEKFIQDSSQSEVETEEHSEISDIQFSFLNWKKSSNLNEEIKQTVENIEEVEIENEVEKSIESETLLKEINIVDEEKISENLVEEIKSAEIIPSEKDAIINSEVEIKNINEKTDEQETLLESTEEWVDDLMEESKAEVTSEEIETKIYNDIDNYAVEENDSEVPEYLKEKNEEFQDYLEEKEIVSDEDSSAIKEAFKYADEKQSRIDSYHKKSYTGIIFAAIIIIATAVIVYFSYYYPGNEPPVIAQNSEPKEFKTVIERSYDIPVSYPYQSGMFAGIYDALSDDLLKPATQEINLEQIEEVVGNKNVPEIKSVLPSKRIKDYIYQYEDGTFALQLSSWKSKTVALSETQKLLDKGFNAFIEETGISGGTYYRVRVGGFKSLEEAENFSININ
ncbi:MAG TPA: SPOR domain-containing protein [Ignavibacteriaceae bacterium]|nr:SPOR domain-containing protein [Ignavibacteriaceae bacterium]